MAKDIDTFKEIPVAEIAILSRIRAVSTDAVAALRQSYEDHGGFTTPIHVRKAKSGYELIDGAHRLTLANELGLETILARVWHCSQAEARFFETDANLAMAHLTPIGLARSLAARHDAYVKLHPETAGGVAGGLARHGQQRTEMSFADFVGAVLGVTPRQVRRIVSAGRTLAPDQAKALEAAPRRVSMNDLYQLSKINNTPERYAVVEALATGTAKNAATARRAYRADRGEGPAPRDATEAGYLRLADAWCRANKAARRRFLEEHGDDVAAALAELGDA
ncbi:ParB/RepB/Spo0J family partition protein [Citreimonas salinaria]|uniref:Chromosome partitioning protein, ParB family n=1 Tax=Citreimonas salinaria TaxID=321339 RepID=A0A1H3KT08_9RHOB|nr:ParB N-terminal domain-containing protein [Citreimonas salinaria]SDY54815.1 chromosome partitioning protein, ParB family [Citreimonas salinaria]